MGCVAKNRVQPRTGEGEEDEGEGGSKSQLHITYQSHRTVEVCISQNGGRTIMQDYQHHTCPSLLSIAMINTVTKGKSEKK